MEHTLLVIVCVFVFFYGSLALAMVFGKPRKTDDITDEEWEEWKAYCKELEEKNVNEQVGKQINVHTKKELGLE